MRLGVIAAAAFSVLVGYAQDPPSAVLQIYRDQINPGRMGAYLQIEEESARYCAHLPCPNPYVALTSITGPSEVWWINGFDSLETMEKVWHDYAANADLSARLNGIAINKSELAVPDRTLLARFRDDLSFSSGVGIATARYVSISLVQIRPGQISTFEKIRLALKAVQQRTGRPQWVYQVTSGLEDGTFLVMTLGRSMQDIHNFSEDRTSNSEMVGNAIASSETRLYSVSPSMSFPAQSWLEADPDFWRRP